MDLQKKPLYALRDLARRLGISAPTALNKQDLIKQINTYKERLENQLDTDKPSNLGRPLLNSCYIAIKKDEKGKIIFYDATQPFTEKVVPDTPRIIIKKRPDAIRDAETRNTLREIKELMNRFSLAIDKVLERE